MTNAHVVSNANRVLITRRVHPEAPGPPSTLPMTVILPFWRLKMRRPLVSGIGIWRRPCVGKPSQGNGYPVGGDRISVTRGVVSRIDFRPYAHFASTRILSSRSTLRSTRAIGWTGPSGRQGRGSCLSGTAAGRQHGYMIPTPVIKRF